jgi:hypothetical protein
MKSTYGSNQMRRQFNPTSGLDKLQVAAEGSRFTSLGGGYFGLAGSLVVAPGTLGAWTSFVSQ